MAPAMLLANLAATARCHASMHDRLRQAYARTLETLGEAIDARDAYTGGHSQRIARYGESIARPVDSREAFAEFIRCSGTQFDPTIVEAFKGLEASLLLPHPSDGKTSEDVEQQVSSQRSPSASDGLPAG